jgi:ankyrin repeat protein
MVAAARGYSEVVEVLLDSGAAIDRTDASGRTALMHAVQSGRREAVRALLDRGADANIPSDDGETALDIAPRIGDVSVLKALLAASASRGPDKVPRRRRRRHQPRPLLSKETEGQP